MCGVFNHWTLLYLFNSDSSPWSAVCLCRAPVTGFYTTSSQISQLPVSLSTWKCTHTNKHHWAHTINHCTSWHQYTHPVTGYTHIYTDTKAYQYGRFSSHWGVQASLMSQHNKTISLSLMKWLTQLTDECVCLCVCVWGGEVEYRAEGGRQPLGTEQDSVDDVVTGVFVVDS